MKTNFMNINYIIAKYSRILIFLAICITLSVVSDSFLTKDNIINVLRQSSLLAVMALGMTFAMLTGKGVDMSVGAVLAFTSCVVAPLLTQGNSSMTIVFGVLLALLMGLLIGAINGVMITYVKLPAFLATFGMYEVVRGLVYMIMSGSVIGGFSKGITFLGSGQLFSIPMPIIIALIITLASMLILKRTIIGRQVYVIGANESAARFSGIKVNRTIIFAFACSGLFAALAGVVYIARLGTAEPQIGETFAFQAIAAVAIGGTSFDGGVGNPFGAILGALILTLLANGMNLLNVSTFWQGSINGLIIILAVVLDQFVSKKATR